jgi:predicted ArsR family transcriptional regulator
MASYELLSAVNMRDVRTTADVAQALGIAQQEAARQLRAAQQDGLVDEEIDEGRHVPADIERCFWYLTSQGIAEWDRLDEQRG